MPQQQKKYLKTKTKFSHFPIKSQVLTLLNDEGFKKPTLVQSQSLPITLQQNLKELCVIVYAYNGAGKTLTYLIPILNSLQMIPQSGMALKSKAGQVPVHRPQALILLPTQALMTQVYEYLVAYANFYEAQFKWPLKIGRMYAHSKENQYGHIIVGLPAKTKQKLSNAQSRDLSQLKWIVFDECDKIKDDMINHFQQILKLFTKQAPSSNFLITSATGDKASFRQFIQTNLPSHNVLELDSKQKNLGLEGITHYYSTAQNKDQVILNILGRLSQLEAKPQVIIFFNEVKQLWNFYTILKNQNKRFVINDSSADLKCKNNLKVNYVHGRVGVCLGQHHCPDDCALNKSERVALLRNESIQVLLGTQSIGRGIDIRTVSLVINYSQPKKNKEDVSPITYIHRVGRTGRYTDEGIALTFISDLAFIKYTEDDQKIKFNEMFSEKQIIEDTLSCSKRNDTAKEDQKLRWGTEDN